MIARGTIVIRNGLIEAVGANVQIPPEATIIDGTGLTVYPGLIDSFSDTGLPPHWSKPLRPDNAAPLLRDRNNRRRKTRKRRFFKRPWD
jgi:imidazolonepropionase-like amidohydrolase